MKFELKPLFKYTHYWFYLTAVHDIMRKTSFAPEKRDADREKRSVSEDSDPYDPEDGKDLLTAYMANVAQYRRQTRSVDDDEEEDDGKL